MFLPVLGMPLAHAPVLRFDLLPRMKRPISQRLFGKNKTWRGALVMSAGTLVATLLAHRSSAYQERLPQEIRETPPVLTGALLGAAVVIGELPNSFAKRRLGIPPGQQRVTPAGIAISVFDQADWVPAAWLLLAPVWRMSAREAATVFGVVTAVHVPINVVGYAIGARTAPI